jgi:hypothetical protein
MVWLFGQCNVSNWQDIVAVSISDNHTVGLKQDGTQKEGSFVLTPLMLHIPKIKLPLSEKGTAGVIRLFLFCQQDFPLPMGYSQSATTNT